MIHDLDSVDESRGQAKEKTTPAGNTKVMGKPLIPTAGGAQQVTSPNPIVQRLPAFLDNHNYAKSPMQVKKVNKRVGPVSKKDLGLIKCAAAYATIEDNLVTAVV